MTHKLEEITVDIEVTGLDLKGSIKKKQVLVVGGQSLKSSIHIQALAVAGYDVKLVDDSQAKETRKILGLDYDLLATDEISRLNALAGALQESLSKTKECYLTYDSIKEHHVGRGDPNGLRQQFNRNGKKFW